MAGFDEDIDIDNSGDKTLQQVLQKVCDAMENSKGQIFEIFESTKREVDETRRSLGAKSSSPTCFASIFTLVRSRVSVFSRIYIHPNPSSSPKSSPTIVTR